MPAPVSDLRTLLIAVSLLTLSLAACVRAPADLDVPGGSFPVTIVVENDWSLPATAPISIHDQARRKQDPLGEVGQNETVAFSYLVQTRGPFTLGARVPRTASVRDRGGIYGGLSGSRALRTERFRIPPGTTRVVWRVTESIVELQ